MKRFLKRKDSTSHAHSITNANEGQNEDVLERRTSSTQSRRFGFKRTNTSEAARSEPLTVSKQRLFNSIGFLCSAQVDDWSLILQLAEGISQDSELAKYAASTLRREIESGQPPSQERAARLLVVLSRNSSDRFRFQIAQKKMLDALQSTYKSKHTQQQVKQMILRVLSVLAYEYQHDRDLSTVTALYNKLKAPEDPINGVDGTGDPVFDPQIAEANGRGGPRSRDPSKMDLWKEAELAKSNAQMLTESLSFTPLEDLDSNSIIKEFYSNCQRSQGILVDALPWATAQADRPASLPPGARPTIDDSPDTNNANSEALLARLLESNEELIGAFKMFDDCHRRKRQQEEERMVQEKSIADTRMTVRALEDHLTRKRAHRGVLQNGQQSDPYGSLIDAPFAQANGASLLYSQATSGSSRNPSPQPASFDATPLPSVDHRAFQQTRAVPQPASNPFDSPQDGHDVPRSTSPFDELAPIESSPQGAKLVKRLSTRNPYSNLIQQEQQQRSLSPSNSISSLSSKNPYAGVLMNQSPDSSPRAAASFPRAESPVLHTGHYAEPSCTLGTIEEDRNPFRLANLSEAQAQNQHIPHSPSGSRSIRTQRTLSNASTVIQTPIEPSEKALGKMRRYSRLYGDDVEDQQRAAELQSQEEQKLRARYAKASGNSRPSSGAGYNLQP